MLERKGRAKATWALVGIAGAAVIAGLGFLILVTSKKPVLAVAVVDELVSPSGRPRELILPVAPEIEELASLHASVDGSPVTAIFTDRNIRIALPELKAGMHLLRTGTEHQGGIVREAHLPLLIGPFDEERDWIDGAVSLRISQMAMSDGDASTDGDLSNALCEMILTRSERVEVFGKPVSCSIAIQPTVDDRNFNVVGEVGSDIGHSISFDIPLQIGRPDPNLLVLRANGKANVEPSESLLDVGGSFGGSLGKLAGRVLFAGNPFALLVGAIAGDALGRDLVRTKVAKTGSELADAALKQMASALKLPTQLTLTDRVSVQLRYHTYPTFTDTGDLVQQIDAKIISAAQRKQGPLVFSTDVAETEPGITSIALSPRLVAQLLQATIETGELDRMTNEKLAEASSANAQVKVSQVQGGIAVVEGTSSGQLRWAIMDLQLKTNLPRDIRAFGRGSVVAKLRDDGQAVVAQLNVEEIYLGCREQRADRAYAVPCLSDVLDDAPALGKKISEGIRPIEIFAEPLSKLANLDLSGTRGLSVKIQPAAIRLGDPRGEPGVRLDVNLTFGGPSASTPMRPSPPITAATTSDTDAVRGLVPSTASASSVYSTATQTFGPELAFDGDMKTAWHEGAPGPGDGEWIEAKFERPTRIDQIRLTTGHDTTNVSGDDVFQRNAHAKRVRVSFDGANDLVREVASDERLLVIDDLDLTASVVRFTFEDVWPGTKWPALPISEISFESAN